MAGKEKYTAAQLIAVLRETKGMVYIAAQRLGCHADTIKNYAKRYASVRAEIHTQSELMKDVAELKLYQAIMDGNEGMIKYYLSTKAKDRGYTTGTEVMGEGGGPLVIQVIYGNERTDGSSS